MNYNSPNGFQTAVWGPLLWTVMHMISFNYPTNPTTIQKKQYMEFFHSLKNVLPCKACRESFTDFVENDPEVKIRVKHFKSRDTLGRWVFDLHNKVNKKLKKPTYKNFERTRNFYEKFRANCSKDKTGCHTPMRGQKKRSIVTIIPRINCKGQKSLSCKRNLV